MGATVRRLHPDDWRVYRTVRLEALASDPSAFGSTWAREAEFTEDQWRERLTSAVFVAELAPVPEGEGADGGGGSPVGAGQVGDTGDGSATGVAGAAGVAGTAGVVVDRERDDVLAVVGMWVRPEARGHGAAGALLRALCGLARESGAKWLQLWVAQGNASARRLYERWGFVDTGERSVLVSDPSVPVVEMMRDVDGGDRG